MPCPYLRRTHPARCTAVAGNPMAPPRLIVITLCRSGFQACPAFRFTRAAGKLLHPGDFVAWVVQRVPPGCDGEAPQPG